MIKRSLLLLAWLSTICWLGAQITVNGHVTISNSLQAVPGHPVDLITNAGFIMSTETNDDGSFTFELDQTVLPPDAVWFVQTIDICTGDVLSESFTTNPNQLTYSVELTICGDIFPPPPPEGCEAFFHWEQAIGTATNPFAVAFFDLSYSNEPIVSWSWSFGDGTSSSEQNPTHQYNGPGEYEVTLTISSEDCTNTITQVVTVWTENNCDCPLDVYDPVCVATPSGQILEFSQPCLAECAGFGPDIYYPCMQGCGCPEYWDPVCVTTPDGNVLTFSNFCFAECEGYTADQYYSCNGCDCPLIYDPVCVVDPNGDLLTFSNACMAECEGYGADQFVPCDGCNCPDVWDPVCVFTTGGVLTFPTPCDAECAGYGPNQYSSCDGCPCPEIADPVCVVGPDGTLIQFDNPCFAGCEGYGPDQFVPCDGCVCPDVWDPVCVFTAAGSITFGNACLAECAGYGPDQYGSCNECPCPEIYDPVCVVGPNGDIIEFDNACFAGCEGYGADSFVDCTPNCECPQDVYDPVCIIVPGCGILDFINPCEAECAGYTADQWTQCPIDCLCPDVWDPVCVMTPFGRYTFGNACEAECYGYSEADFIPCIDDCICPLVYAPVCVIDPAGNLLTFDNACFAQCEGYGEDQFVNCTNNCPCPAIYDPVCVVGPNGDVITFNNLCEAECEGYGPDQIVPCNGICDCPDVYYPVCVTDPATGEQLQFPNPCLAICEGYGDQTLMDCDDCHCINPVWDPVCVEAGGGIITYMNSCEATCAGFSEDQWMECGDCVCPQIYDPVCVYTPSGGVLTFNNACEAECAGYSPEVYTECDGGCNCPDIWDPVCVATGGAILQFGNACEAECAGYTDYFSCDTDPCSVMIHYDQIDELTFVFAAVSPSPIGGFVWDFGDGTTSDEPNPTHTYPDDFVGTFTVTVTFTGTQGCVATASVMITIGDDCICPDVWDPVCVYDPNGNVLTFGNACEAECAGYSDYFECDNNNCPVAIDFEPIDQFTYIFSAITTSTAGQVVWDFGDGEFSDEPSPTHTFPEGPGTYQVTVTFTSADGCTATASVWITIGDGCNCDDVWDPVCVAGFAGLITFPNACEAICAGFSPDLFVPCDECPCPAIYDPVCVLGPNGNIITFGNACEAECAGYGPDAFVDCNGCECGDVYEPVCVQTPIGIITYNNSCEASCAGYCFEDFVSCDDDCICPDIYAPVCVINWTTGEIIEFVNSCYAQCAGYGPDQQFPCDGPECHAAFDFTFSSSNDLLVQFHDQSFAGGGITSWWWDFGDGSGSDEQNPQHTYPAPGIYDVILTISGPDCSATIIQHICVGEGGGVGGPDCQAMFFFEQPDPSNLLIFSFADISFGGADSWLWDFGDGTGSTEQYPTHTYAAPGLYDVTLTITNGDCSSSITMAVFTGINVWYGNDECRAWFLPIIDPATNSVYFVNLSSADAIEFAWDFGDGTTSTNPLAFHAYEAGGDYTVSLTITTESGCVNTFSASFTLGVEGDDGFTGSPIFSLVNSVDEAPVEELAVALAPNPTRAESIVSWQGTTAGTYSWNLYDLNGRLLTQGSGHSRGQLEQFELDLTRFSSGIYLLRLQTPDGTRALKVTKM